MDELESLDERKKPPIQNKSLQRRRSLITSSNIPFEDQLSLITLDLTPEERLKKMFRLCVRATAHSLNKDGDGGELFYKLLSYEPDRIIGPKIESVFNILNEKIKSIQNHSQRLQSELNEWDKELESRRKKYYYAKLECKSHMGNPSSYSSTLHEGDFNDEMKKFLNDTSKVISMARSGLQQHRLRFKCYRIQEKRQQLQLKRQIDSAGNTLKHICKMIKNNTNAHYTAEEENIYTQHQVFKESIKKIQSLD